MTLGLLSSLDGVDAMCDFGSVFSHHSILTTIHNVDYGRLAIEKSILVFKFQNQQGLRQIINSNNCFQSLDQLCRPLFQQLYDMDDSIDKDPTSPGWSWTHIHHCMCIRYTNVLTLNASRNNER